MRDADEMRGKKGFWKSVENESGMMVVEAALSFVVFIMVCLAIVFLINIFTVHNRIQFAINSAAKELYLFDRGAGAERGYENSRIGWETIYG